MPGPGEFTVTSEPLVTRTGVSGDKGTYDLQVTGPPYGLDAEIASNPVAGQMFATVMGLLDKCIGIGWGGQGWALAGCATGNPDTGVPMLSLAAVSSNGKDFNQTNWTNKGLFTILPFRVKKLGTLVAVAGYTLTITGEIHGFPRFITDTLVMCSADFGKTWTNINIPIFGIVDQNPEGGFAGGASVLSLGWDPDQQKLWAAALGSQGRVIDPFDPTDTGSDATFKAWTGSPGFGQSGQVPSFSWQEEYNSGTFFNFPDFLVLNNGAFSNPGYPRSTQLVDNAIMSGQSGHTMVFDVDYRCTVPQGDSFTQVDGLTTVTSGKHSTSKNDNSYHTVDNNGVEGSVDLQGVMTFGQFSANIPGGIATPGGGYPTPMCGVTITPLGVSGFLASAPALASAVFNPPAKPNT